MTAATEMKMRSILPYFGGKRTLAKAIVQELGGHKAYWEPFCGSAAILLEKKPCSQETVSDLHEDLTNLAWVLRNPIHSETLYDMLGRVCFSESIFEYARHYLQNAPLPTHTTHPPDIERAYWYFIFSWMGRNGLAGTSRALSSSLAVRHTSGGGSPSIRFRSAIESIPAWHYRLVNVLILRRDAFELLAEIEDAAGTVIYVDSPYLMETRSEGAAHDQGARYLYDFGSTPPAGGLFSADRDVDDHDRMAAALGRFKHARIVVSYYWHPRLELLYPNFTVRKLDATKKIAQQNRRGLNDAIDAAEVLLINGPSFAEGAR